ncbi:TRAP transporter small permease [Stappia sp. ES.058]|uniref:TRAP transporter small permease n=1 Tax=Stappia sp. ES.058 TaxID=1881061 RepID=UPI0008797B15|nr:TRAP transporter small permease [Stappia sp. ES.058]SDU41070.1 TRAP-type C4-dicarboxylate transport system, small permease component [Stappia sp. ES.058]
MTGLRFGESTGSGIRRLVGLAGLVLRLAASLLLLTMMIVTFVDVLGRELFSAPLPGAYELTEVLLALVIFVGLPITTARREHVSVDLLTARLPTTVRRGLAVFAAIVTAAVLIVLAWRLAVSAGDFTAYGDATVYLGIPLGPVAGAMAVFTAVAAVIAVAVVFRRD